MTCPNCDNPVPMMAVWQATGLSGVVCPHCNSSLRPVYWRSAVLLAFAMIAGNFEGSLLRASGYAVGFVMLGMALTVFLVYAALAPFVLRLRVKADGTALLPHIKN
jgi:hypothetical protein